MSLCRHLILPLALLVIGAGVVSAQTYPGKPINIILPYAPGGATSTLAYLIRQKLTENWGEPVVVLHRPGGNAVIGTEAAAKSPPDGYTLVLVTTSHVTNALLLPTKYDAIKDFTPVASIARVEVMLVVHPTLPVKTLKEFITLAKATPGQLNYATATTGSPAHLAAELFNVMVGLQLQAIPYKGGAPAIADVIGGQVESFFGNPINVVHHINSGRLKGIAISGDKRLQVLKHVATFAESGLQGFDVGFWQGILAPAGTPKPIVDKLSAEVARILALPDSREKIINLGAEPFISNPEQFAAVIRADMDRYAKVIKARNIKIE